MGAPRLERYEIESELGQGGMSIVYRARDKQLSRPVAVKVLHDFLARQEDARRRFHREAVAVAKLRDPGIVEIYDYSGPDAKDSYIVTELIEGKTLRVFIEELGPVRHPELGVLVIAELARALRHAHEQGVVHRDLKPENVMITPTGQLKLMDFGIAQIMGGATKLTATGTLLGSPAHMAPEVIDGKASDHRSDIFSVGTILYWLATGQLPFAAPNPSALFRLILEGRYPAPQEISPRVGNGLARILERCLEPNLELRYQDISELQADLHKELAEVDLEPADSLVKRYLARPVEFADELRPKLVAKLTHCGKQALAAKNVGRAMDHFNRVLAVEPDHAEVRALVAKVGRQQRVAVTVRRTATMGLTLSLIGGAAYGGVELYPRFLPPPENAAPPVARLEAAPTPAPGPAPPPKLEATPAPALAIAEAKGPTPPPAGTRPKNPRPSRPAGPETKPDGAEPPPTLEPKPVETPEPEPTKPPVSVIKPRLKLKLGLTHANVKVDGVLRRESTFLENLELTPGVHRIELVKPELGRVYRLTVEVDAEGRIYEQNDGERRPLPSGELTVKVPRSAAEADSFKGWTSS